MKSLVSDLIQSERKRCVRTPQVEAADFLLDHRRYDASVNLELGCTETETGLDQLLLFDHMARTCCQPQMGPCPVRTARDLVRRATVCVNEYTPGSIGHARLELILALQLRKSKSAQVVLLARVRYESQRLTVRHRGRIAL